MNMKKILLVLVLILSGCETETMVYFACEGHETKNYLTNVTNGFSERESLVVDKMTETL